MLVLTRRSKDKIVFPQVGITLHFIRVQSGQVKVGVDAPRDIRVLRDELFAPEQASTLCDRQLSYLPKDVRHGIRNELHQISVGLYLYKELVAASLMDEASETFDDIQAALERLDKTEALNSPATTPPKPASETVVLVEDQLNEREMLASLLRLQSVPVVTLEDGNQAINYFHENPAPGYLLIDMKMPECDGPTAITQLRAEGKLDDTRVFAVSGTSPEAFGISINSEGVDRWFAKPVDPSLLLEAIDCPVS
ncbi:response regulator [Planctomycetes bacterium K23_9]|uniref:Translational regulator CsrA n=1 Tax=Stieleria marina TaxID=1930275 RepID=A0A517NWU5_9BACT|nr:CAI-1 autoinducer sensor kinase/phosphatase CqsS [Planctomycetes bacterium K23_9]